MTWRCDVAVGPGGDLPAGAKSIYKDKPMVDFIRDDDDEPRNVSYRADGPFWRLVVHAAAAWAMFALLLRYTWPGGSFPAGFWGWMLRFWWVHRGRERHVRSARSLGQGERPAETDGWRRPTGISGELHGP